MASWKTEHGVEFNVLLLYGPLLIQPVIQHYANVGAIGGHAFVAGFRTKIDFQDASVRLKAFWIAGTKVRRSAPPRVGVRCSTQRSC